MSKNIVHQYFKKELDGSKVLVKVDPIHFKGTEINVTKGGEIGARDLDFDEQIFSDLQADGFLQVSAMEFNLYLSGLI